jgi:tRNA-dihydrouridine synthase B
MDVTKKIPSKSIMLAPMEGVTDATYRKTVNNLFPTWSTMACDFLRVPSQGSYPTKKIISHFGEEILEDQALLDKSCYQILTSERSLTEKTVKQISSLGFKWLDLNLGCPSKKVNGHGGGSALLKDLKTMREIVRAVRQSFPDLFTAKIRLGFHDDGQFLEILNLLQEEGVQAITIHGRTREQMYKGKASWEHIKKAVEVCDIPIIGNGDIWEISDIKKIFDETNCHAVMCARGAMKTPWMADLYHEYQDRILQIDQDLAFKNELRIEYSKAYFEALYNAYKNKFSDQKILKRFKGLSRYIFDDFPQIEMIKPKIYRQEKMNNFFNIIENIPTFQPIT